MQIPNYDLKTKISISVSILAILLISFGFYIKNGFESMHQLYGNIINNDLYSIENTQILKTLLLQYRNTQLQGQNNKNIKQITTELEQAEDQINNIFNVLLRIFKKDVKYYNMIVQLEQSWLFFLEENAKFIGYSKHSSKQAADSIALKNSNHLYDEMIKIINKVNQYNKTIITHHNNIIKKYVTNRIHTIILVIAVMISLIIALLLLISIFIKKIHIMRDTLDKAVINNEEIVLDSNSAGELGQLAQSINAFNNIINDKKIISNKKLQIKEEEVLRNKLFDLILKKFEINLHKHSDESATFLREAKGKINDIITKTEDTIFNTKILDGDVLGLLQYIQKILKYIENLNDIILVSQTKVEHSDNMIRELITQMHDNIDNNSISSLAERVINVASTIETAVQQINILTVNFNIKATGLKGSLSPGFLNITQEIQMLSKQVTEATNDMNNHIYGINKLLIHNINSVDSFVEHFLNIQNMSEQIIINIKQEASSLTEMNEYLDKFADVQQQIQIKIKQIITSTQNTDEISQEISSLYGKLNNSLISTKITIDSLLQDFKDESV